MVNTFSKACFLIPIFPFPFRESICTFRSWNHSPRDGKSPTLWCVRWRWKAFGVFFFFFSVRKWCHDSNIVTEREIQNWTVGLAQFFFVVRITINTSRCQQRLQQDRRFSMIFFGTFWRLTKTQPHFVGKKGFLQFKLGTRSSQRSSNLKQVDS